MVEAARGEGGAKLNISSFVPPANVKLDHDLRFYSRAPSSRLDSLQNSQNRRQQQLEERNEADARQMVSSTSPTLLLLLAGRFPRSHTALLYLLTDALLSILLPGLVPAVLLRCRGRLTRSSPTWINPPSHSAERLPLARRGRIRPHARVRDNAGGVSLSAPI